MDKWIGRVALVTGASVGIGAALCRSLANHGMKVIGLARRVDNIQAIANELSNAKGSLTAIKCDVTKDEEVLGVFQQIKKDFGRIDVCINNAGMSHKNSLLDGTPTEWREMLDVNVVSVCLITKECIALMKEKNIDDGHIINIGSMSGHRVAPYSSVHFYAGTKHALRSITEGLRQELRAEKSHIRVTGISPGVVETEFILAMTNDKQKSKDFYSSMKCLQAEDISDAVIHALAAPAHVDINDIMIRPTEQLLLS